ncbi:MAG: FAD-dependent thymidylate synthase [Parcubacteria group bacterium]|nr:FAD-dependent thymidylate synthase [Parcubacteria group bacterium]
MIELNESVETIEASGSSSNEDGAITKRMISDGGEKWLGKKIDCLDHGFVYLVDYMGNDESVAQAARVSYGKGTKKTSDDRALIRYLRRHAHTTPFEMVEFKFHCKMPIFVARQWIRHRTASVNEYSARYSKMSNEFYMPELAVLRKQSATNKQGRAEELTEDQQKTVLHLLRVDYENQYDHYEHFLEMDLARELARIGLSVANYTEWYWKIDLHNLMHFLKLRLDAHAQYEIRVYGEAIAQIVKDVVPICFEAFEDYELYAMKLTRSEIRFVQQHSWPADKTVVMSKILDFFENRRESEEFIEKLKELHLVFDT